MQHCTSELMAPHGAVACPAGAGGNGGSGASAWHPDHFLPRCAANVKEDVIRMLVLSMRMLVVCC